jgi:hypothetical protein
MNSAQKSVPSISILVNSYTIAMTPLSEKKIHKIGRIDQIVCDYFQTHPDQKEVPAKRLMPLFIEKGIFFKNHRDGLPIRSLLRHLDKENMLPLLKHVQVVRHAANRNWYFAPEATSMGNVVP